MLIILWKYKRKYYLQIDKSKKMEKKQWEIKKK